MVITFPIINISLLIILSIIFLLNYRCVNQISSMNKSIDENMNLSLSLTKQINHLIQKKKCSNLVESFVCCGIESETGPSADDSESHRISGNSLGGHLCSARNTTDSKESEPGQKCIPYLNTPSCCKHTFLPSAIAKDTRNDLYDNNNY